MTRPRVARNAALAWCVVACAAACGDGAVGGEGDLAIRVSAASTDVDFGKAFQVTVVRTPKRASR